MIRFRAMDDAGLYSRLLGPAFDRLSAPLRNYLGGAPTFRARGVFRVTRGAGPIAAALALAMRAPRASDAAAVELLVTRDAAGESWHRRFPDRSLSSRQTARGALLVEAFGPFEACFSLAAAEGGALEFHLAGFALTAGRLRIPVPSWLAPRIEARAFVREGRIHTSVSVSTSLSGLVMGYDGSIEEERPA